MNHPTPFFFIGSRRSGTTMVCHIINFHPRLYCPFERYIMWIIRWVTVYGSGEGLCAPPRGVFDPMWITLSEANRTFFHFERSGRTLQQARTAFFQAIHAVRMKRETGKWRERLVAIGEKNPPEYATPAMNTFIRSVLPDARFVHVVRHPVATCRSRMDFKSRYEKQTPRVPWYWTENMQVNLGEWMQIERDVLEVKRSDCPVLTIRYEDLCESPLREAKRLYEFLGVSGNADIDHRIRQLVKGSGNDKYDLQVEHDVPGLQEMMERYGYA